MKAKRETVPKVLIYLLLTEIKSAVENSLNNLLLVTSFIKYIFTSTIKILSIIYTARKISDLFKISFVV